MNPAQKLAQAIDLAQQAANDLHRLGVDNAALRGLDNIVADLKAEYGELPDAIFDAECEQCRHCQHGKQEQQRLAVGDAFYMRDDGIECGAVWFQCPSVIAAGFTDD